jgi:uncharacterized protein (TIGR02996 family)
MTDGYALLRAIEADPDDDTPRLVYADWLDEHAESDADRARAELIRVQCELARTPPGDRKAELAAREYRLLSEHRKEWAAAYPVRLPRNHAYARGFMSFTLDAAVFAKHGEALAAVTPLHRLVLKKVAKGLADAAACPALRFVRYLSLDTSELQNQHLPALLGSPNLTNVRTLCLSNNAVGVTGCAALAAATSLPALRVLALSGNFAVRDRGLDALTGAPWFPHLVGLHVPSCGTTSAALIRLAGLPAVGRLRSLAVSPWTATTRRRSRSCTRRTCRAWCGCGTPRAT